MVFVDWLLLLPVIIISIFSNAVLISTQAFIIPNNLIFLFLGWFFFLIASLIDVKIWKNFDKFFYLFSLALLLATFAFGTQVKGATRWINLGFFPFQPSEIVKPFLIIAFASFAVKFNLKKLNNSLVYFLLSFPIFLLVFKQPDLGNAIIYLLIFLSIFFTAGGSLLFLGVSTVLFGLVLPFGWHFLKEYQKQRITSFLHPTKDPLGLGYNLIQAIITVGSGAFFGRGLGIGTQSQLKFLPERSTDFIFASLAEEIGFIGCLLLLLFLFLLLLRILTIAANTQDLFSKNICYGVFAMIFFQATINIGMNIGILPITGVTLPLVSQGGSSLIATLISLGLVNNISCQKKRFVV